MTGAFINEEFDITSTISMWTVLQVRHVKMIIHLLPSAASPRVWRVVNSQGLKASTPNDVKGSPGAILSVGKSAIFWVSKLRLSLRQATHLYTREIHSFAPMSQYFPLRTGTAVKSRSWKLRISKVEMWLALGRIIGSTSLAGICPAAWLILPSTQNSPFSSK